ncbi:MAG: protein translocase subunit SecF [Actinobacteria bacterium]|nr:protein translocase subunit SecF [Actinomycetota bacterium]
MIEKLRFDFMGRKYWWFALSGIIIITGLISLATRGLNLSIDFKGGSRLTAKFSQKTNVNQVRSLIAGAGYPSAVVQTISGGYYQVTLPSLQPSQEDAVDNALNARFHLAEPASWNDVGPTFGRQVATSMLEAVILAWVIIIVYVSFRFEYKSAVATLVALIHDLLVTVGVYSIVGREVTTATVAAVLTILGYSLYDTIIVFDRIRENSPKARRGLYGQMVNSSIWEVMTRSIITTLLTLLPVACLLVFGGETLKDFAFALLVGITSGAYSSIFVAAPLLTMWKEREKRYRPQPVRVKGKGKAKAKAKTAKSLSQ